ncbi:hypothetical protein MTO96_006548 [Rhipicephalus appendiculatus]
MKRVREGVWDEEDSDGCTASASGTPQHRRGITRAAPYRGAPPPDRGRSPLPVRTEEASLLPALRMRSPWRRPMGALRGSVGVSGCRQPPSAVGRAFIRLARAHWAR